MSTASSSSSSTSSISLFGSSRPSQPVRYPRSDAEPSASPLSSLPPSTASPGQTPNEKKSLQGWKHSAAGSLGGMTGAIVTSPFDVVKTRLQSDLFRAQNQPRSGVPGAAGTKVPPPPLGRGGLWHFVDTVALIGRIGREEGWRALYKGLGPMLVGIIPARATNFYFYPTSKAYLAQQFPNAPTEKPGQTAEDSPVVHLGAAVIAGIATATFTNPIWVVKTRLQLEARKRSPVSVSAPIAPSPLPRPIAASAAALSQTARINTAAAPAARSNLSPAFTMTMDILRQEGIRGIYKGLSASYLGVSEGVIQWVLYERFKRLSRPVPVHLDDRTAEKPSVLSYIGSIVGASGGAKTIASLITYPHEVVRTRLRQPAVNGVHKYTGIVQSLKLIVKEEGVARLYGGLSAHLLRVVPNAACMFLIYEVVAEKLA